MRLPLTGPPEPAATVVAIDGPAGAGKSTVARQVAARLGFAHLDTGAMYRAVALLALERGLHLNDARALAALAREVPLRVEAGGRVHVGSREVTAELRTERVNAAVSAVAGVPEVRSEMVRHQREFARTERRVVAEGRDMSSVVFPDARVKIYLDADASERARRRTAEEGRPASPEALAQTRAGLADRDARDTGRTVGPLVRAADAWYLDTTGLSLEEVVERVLARVRSAACLPVPPADGR